MKGRNSETLEDRLLRNCHKGTCWEWTAHKDKNGYGRMRYQWIEDAAHRFAYQAWVGKIPKATWVLHHCDNPSCIRPDHLFLGTAADNASDRDKKGRTGWNPKSGDNGRKAKRDNWGRFICGV